MQERIAVEVLLSAGGTPAEQRQREEGEEARELG